LTPWWASHERPNSERIAVSGQNGATRRTHYDTLGIDAAASSDQVRKAYLAKARQLHPDQYVGRPSADLAKAERLMKELNVAWTVLNNPVSRRAYDYDLRMAREANRPVGATVRPTGPVSGSAPPRPKLVSERPSAAEARTAPKVASAEEMDLGRFGRLVRSGPLLAMAALFLLILIIVAIAGGGGDDSQPAPSSTESGVPIAENGATPVACVELEPNAIEVPCGDHDAVAWAVITEGEDCPPSPPNLAKYYREGLGGLWCVVAP
jgi:hypothetical protein